MWREIALDKIKNKRGSLSFKTQREINTEQQKKLEEFNQKISRLHDLNIKFHEVSINELPAREEVRVN
ncbi:hypothetical protein [Oceanobacillus damuensis]|uniref:hypothetical protein n=1 Tax=Oceanobacillus damuensis TaxID=937928 RepID=UPI00082BBF37|nr:hypothetical protein [Oceanobacillus damuensis]